MNIIVSTSLKDSYSTFKVVNSIKDASKETSIDYLVLHSFPEGDYEAGVSLAEMKSRVKSGYAYICSDPSVVISTLIRGVGGFQDNSDFYFDNEEELLDAIKNGDSTSTELAINTPISIIEEFLKAYINDDDSIKTPLYLDRVNNALDEIRSTQRRFDVHNRDITIALDDTFRNVSESLKTIAEQKRSMDDKVKGLVELAQQSVGSTSKSNIEFYSSYSHSGTVKVLYIKEYSPCRYLTTLLLGYAKYLTEKKAKNVRLVFAYGRGSNVHAKYSSNLFTNITVETKGRLDLYNAPVIATNHPSNEVIKTLFDRSVSLDCLIFVDRLYDSDLITGSKVFPIRAVSGLSDVDRYHLRLGEVLTPILSTEGVFGSIKHIKGYANTSSNQQRAVLLHSTHAELYGKFDKLLGV